MTRWNGLWRLGAGTPDDPNNGRLIYRVTPIGACLYAQRIGYTWKAKARIVYWILIRRYETELCQRCGNPVGVVFHAPDDLWELATGWPRFPDGESAPGVLCPPCVDALVEPQIDGYLTWTCAVTRR